MTFYEYVAAVHEAMTKHADWRLGQAAFNVLQTMRPDLSDRVARGSALDPFYQDKRTDAFLQWVQRHWNDQSDADLGARLDSLRY